MVPKLETRAHTSPTRAFELERASQLPEKPVQRQTAGPHARVSASVGPDGTPELGIRVSPG